MLTRQEKGGETTLAEEEQDQIPTDSQAFDRVPGRHGGVSFPFLESVLYS